MMMFRGPDGLSFFLGGRSLLRFIHALEHNHHINCPITVDDARRAEKIFGKDVAFLKGKTTASPPKEHLSDRDAIPVPSSILSSNTKVTLCFDIFYVLGLTFSLSASRNIRYISCRPLTDRTDKHINGALLPTRLRANRDTRGWRIPRPTQLFPRYNLFYLCSRRSRPKSRTSNPYSERNHSRDDTWHALQAPPARHGPRTG